MPFYGQYTRSQALVAHHILFHLCRASVAPGAVMLCVARSPVGASELGPCPQANVALFAPGIAVCGQLNKLRVDPAVLLSWQHFVLST